MQRGFFVGDSASPPPPANAVESFWIVWSPQGGTNPKVRFESAAAARTVAKDMARR